MKHLLSSFAFIVLLPSFVVSQHKALKIEFETQVSESARLPFSLKTVRMNLSNKDTLGWLRTSKKSESFVLLFPTGMDSLIQDYLSKRFNPLSNEVEISMEITTLNIQAIQAGKIMPNDTLQFACKFFKKEKESEELLYNFNAGSSVGVTHRPELVIQNMIKRALDAAVIQFTKSYAKTPEWSEDKSQRGIKVKTQAFHNRITGKDTIACEENYILKAEDFLGLLPKESNPEEGIGRLGLTYSAESEESSKGMRITISTKAYFDRTRSWKNKQVQQTNWLEYQQAHFDLCTVFGNRLRDSVDHHSFSAGEFRSEMNKIYNAINNQLISTRNLLVLETAKGKDIGALRRWRQQIDIMMTKK